MVCFLLFIAVILLHAEICFSQKPSNQNNIISIEKTISEFDEIALDQDFNLFVFEGTSQNLIIESEERLLNEIYADVHDRTLNITCNRKIENPKILNVFVTTTALRKIIISGKVKIKIYSNVTKEIEIYLVNETSFVKLYLSDKNIQASVKGFGTLAVDGIFNDLSFKIYDEVKLNLDITSHNLQCFASDKSFVSISGLSKELNLFTQDDASINSFNMYSDKCSVNVRDASEVKINQSTELYIAGENQSSLNYRGEPIIIVRTPEAISIKNRKEKNFVTGK